MKCPKPKKKWFVAKVMAIGGGNKILPDWGLGQGVIGTIEVGFADLDGEGFDSPLFWAKVAQTEEMVLRKFAKVVWEEKQGGRK